MKVMPKKWTNEAIAKEAKKYETRNEFQKGNNSAYNAARSQGILDKVCKYMKPVYKNWSNAAIAKEAKKYQTRGEFKKGSDGAYQAARRRGIIEAVCSEMHRAGNRMLRFVYAYLYLDTMQAYVGITYNLTTRQRDHESANTRLGKLLRTGAEYEYVETTEVVDVDSAGLMEQDWLEYYQNQGFEMLNIAKTGGTGGGTAKWTPASIEKEAKKYQSRNEFKKGSDGAYQAARRLKIMDKVCSQMTAAYTSWDKDSIAKEAKKYQSRNEFQQGSYGAYQAAQRRGILDDVCKHMTPVYKRWDKDSIEKEAKKYQSRKAFEKGNTSAYQAALRLKIMDDVCKHMPKRRA